MCLNVYVMLLLMMVMIDDNRLIMMMIDNDKSMRIWLMIDDDYVIKTFCFVTQATMLEHLLGNQAISKALNPNIAQHWELICSL